MTSLRPENDVRTRTVKMVVNYRGNNQGIRKMDGDTRFFDRSRSHHLFIRNINKIDEL